MARHGPHKVHQRQIQSSARVEEQTPVPEWSGEQLFGKDPEGLGGQQAEYEAAMCPGMRRANGLLSCVGQSTASRLREVILPLSTSEAHLQGWDQFWASKQQTQSYWSESAKGQYDN